MSGNISTQKQQKQQKQTSSLKVSTTPSTTAPTPTQMTTQATATSPQELKNYKIALRNKIASKIDFLSVVGDGNCTVVFKISSNGALTERKFQKQSDNDSLNDAVYKAVLSVPSYNPPPKGYNNELLRLGVKIVGENFEVSLN